MALYNGSNYKAVGGNYVVGKTPIHTELMLRDPLNGGAPVYIPVKAFQWNKETELVDNLHSGTPLPSGIIDGHHKYTFSFETGTWLTKEVDKEHANKWEWLAYTYLVRPYDAGRPRVFDIYHKESPYVYDEGGDSGGETIIWFTGCKISKMAFSQGENGIMKRTFDGMARRLTYGTGAEEAFKA